MALQPLSFRWPEHLVDRIDAARGLASRTAFVAQAMEAIIDGTLVPAVDGDKRSADLRREDTVYAVMKRIPSGRAERATLPPPLSTQDALTRVQARHAAKAAEVRAEQAARLGEPAPEPQKRPAKRKAAPKPKATPSAALARQKRLNESKGL